MSATLTLKKRPPPAKNLNDRIRRQVAFFVTPILESHVENREQIVEPHWSTPHNFSYIIEMDIGGIMFRVLVNAEAAPSASVTKWRLLSEGTNVRYAIMSRDFIPKTAVDTFRSRRGRGGRVAIVDEDQGGIEARNYDENINRTLLPSFKLAIVAGYESGFKR